MSNIVRCDGCGKEEIVSPPSNGKTERTIHDSFSLRLLDAEILIIGREFHYCDRSDSCKLNALMAMQAVFNVIIKAKSSVIAQ